MRKRTTQKRSLLLSLFLVLSLAVAGQKKEAADSLLALGDTLRYDNPGEGIRVLKEAAQLAYQLDYYWGKMKAQQYLANAFSQTGESDSVYHYIYRAIALSVAEGDAVGSGHNYNILSRQFSENGRYPEAVKHNLLSLNFFRSAGDTTNMVYALWDIGWAYSQLDQLDSAMVYFTEGLSYAEATADKGLAGNLMNSIATVHKRMGNYEKSLEIYNQSIASCQEAENEFCVLAAYNNIGILFKAMKDYDQALAYYEKAETLARQLNNERGEMSLHINKGILLNLLQRYREAETELRAGLELARKYNITISIADACNSLSRSLLNQNKIAGAVIAMQEGLSAAKKAGSLEKESESHEAGKELYLKLGNAEKAIAHMDTMQMLRDSMFQLAKAEKIDALQVQYETAKKDAEIDLLKKNAEIQSAKRRTLVLGFFLLLACALAVIAFLYLSKRNADLKLAFKKQELTAHALSLARKNELLKNLKEKAEDLSHADAADTGYKKLISAINSDLRDDESWEQFTGYFNQVHKDFNKTVLQRFPAVTPNELRYMALIKMNLSSKEIASIMNITDNGVKKARQRLRKKLDMDSKDSLEVFINTL